MKKLIILLIGIVAFTYSAKAQSGATARATAGEYVGTFDVVVALQ